MREDIELHTADGLTLVGEVATPRSGPIRGTLLCLHPLPTHGGFMDSHVMKKAALRLPALAGIAVVRFNLRGTSSPRGMSEGQFDGGVAERFDVQAVKEFAQQRQLPNPWLLGWSFGTELVLKYGLDTTGVDPVGGILLSPPLHRAAESDIHRWGRSGKPLVVLVPEYDDYLRPAEARDKFAAAPQAQVIDVDGAKHLWVGEKYAKRALDEISSAVLGEPIDLPSLWKP